MRTKTCVSTVVFVLSTVLCSDLCPLLGGPQPGDVFCEHYWYNARGDAGNALRVGGKHGQHHPDRGWAHGQVNAPVTLDWPLDLEGAVRAEAVIEKILCHDSTRGLAIRWNGKEWIPVPEAEGIPYPQWEYQHHTYPVVAVPLSHLREGTGNRFEMKVDPDHPWKWPQNLINGVHLRVYYDPARKAHSTGRITSVNSGAQLGRSVELEVRVESPGRPVRRVDYVGDYEDVNFEGDGRYLQWHYHFLHGEIMNHLGSATKPPFTANWDTSWVPDQKAPFRIAARLVGVDGTISMTEAVTGLTLERPGLSVELCKPYGVPKKWVTRAGEKEERFDVTGDPAKAVALQLVWSSWSPGYMNGVLINGVKVFDSEGPKYKYCFHRVTLDDASMLRRGTNVLMTGKTPLHDGRMVHGMEVNWPGIMVLVQYRKGDRDSSKSARPSSSRGDESRATTATGRPRGPRPPPGGRPRRPAGVLTHVPSSAAGEQGVAVRVLAPPRPRYTAGAPVLIHVPGGVGPGAAAGRPEAVGLGFVEIFFAFPGGGREPARSGGTYDVRGPASIRALSDVIRFATGRLRDREGRALADLAGETPVLSGNCGLIGWSHGGNACAVSLALHGEEFPDLAFYVSMESPYGEGAANVELGGFESGVNPAYDPNTGSLDLSYLAWSPDLPPAPFRRRGGPGVELRGALFFDMDRDRSFSAGKDFPAHVFIFDAGQGRKAYHSPRLLREAERRSLYGPRRPDHIPSVDEATEFWRYRDAAAHIPEVIRKCRGLAVIVYAGLRDHVQAAPDHPHILTQVEGFRRSGARFVRLNPDRAYVERILEAGDIGGTRLEGAPADNPAGTAVNRGNLRHGLEPFGLSNRVFVLAAACELADRVQRGEWAPDVEAVLYPEAPWRVPPPRPGDGRPRRGRDMRRPADVPGEPYGAGTKDLHVDGSRAIGKIRSLLGVNRGPLFFRRQGDGKSENHVESYRRLGIDFIRTHDFYGPTDWHVIFPNWDADPDDPASYDFHSSDVRIRAIVENGFRCLYRLGTSWKGRESRPIHDPPGTRRGTDGRVPHHADREDFRKWAKICVQTIHHYTQGWKEGYHFPIEYWEIWNEPDLAAQFWTGTPEQYYTMYEEAARAIKASFPKVKVGGPACTGALRQVYVEDFIRYCRDREVPLDFFSWHSYGGRRPFNPHTYYEDARRVRRILDGHGFQSTENVMDEWNAGIGPRLFSNTPAGAAFYVSTLACLLDADVDLAFQYCGDGHPGLGLHALETGEPKICAYAFVVWKRLLETPERLETRGGDELGYKVVAGRAVGGNRVQILISDFQSGHDAFRLQVANLPWGEDVPFKARCFLLDSERRLEEVEEVTARGSGILIERPFRSRSVCLIDIERAH